MTAEPVSIAHADAMAAINAAAFPPEEAWLSKIISFHIGQPGGFGYIDRRGGMILARTTMEESEILTIAVMPQAQRQGLGRELMQAAMRHAAAAGADVMYLEVAEENIAARRLYQALHFDEIGRRKRYYSNGDDALVMRLVLNRPAADRA
jgi:ribosomal-protein-alanine N-acetyltransferase